MSYNDVELMYYNKYLKYKAKYIELQFLLDGGGVSEAEAKTLVAFFTKGAPGTTISQGQVGVPSSANWSNFNGLITYYSKGAPVSDDERAALTGWINILDKHCKPKYCNAGQGAGANWRSKINKFFGGKPAMSIPEFEQKLVSYTAAVMDRPIKADMSKAWRPGMKIKGQK
jgi:hypothetical protein